MKHYQTFSWALAALLLLTACSSDDASGSYNPWGGAPDASRAIKFSTSDASSRASRLTGLTSFKVYAYKADGSTLIDGETYTKSGETWTAASAKTYYWPTTGSVAFYAYANADDNVSYDATRKTLTYNVPADMSQQKDLVFATAAQAYSEGNTTVTLPFAHALASTDVRAAFAPYAECVADVSISSSVVLHGVRPTATIDFATATVSASGDPIDIAVPVTATRLYSGNKEAQLSATDDGYVFLPPQTLTPWDGASDVTATTGSYIELACKVNTTTHYLVGSADEYDQVYVPCATTLAMGQNDPIRLVFGTLNQDTRYGTDKAAGLSRYYGRKADGSRIVTPDVVDLGLTDSNGKPLLWANANVGAATPVESGNYYAWGETEPKESYTKDNYTHTTYYASGTNLAASEDAATAHNGEQWRMPTISEYQQLLSTTNYTWSKDTWNGMDGYKVTSKKEGYTDKYIFFPATRVMQGTTLSAAGMGQFWTSTDYNNDRAHSLYFQVTSATPREYHDTNRYTGVPVRAVYTEPEE